MKKTVILINLRFSDFYSPPLFKLVKDKGVRLVAIIDEQFKGQIGPHILPYLDQVHVLPSIAKDGFLSEFNINPLRLIVASEANHADDVRIVCTDEFNLLNAGILRREFSLMGATDIELLPFRDKLLMKSLLKAKGIRVPNYKLLTSSDSYYDIGKELGAHFIVKPVDSSGSHGVYAIKTAIDFTVCKNKTKHYECEFEAEEFIDGKLYHVDSYTENHEIKFICANEYAFPNHDYTRGKVLSSFPLDEHDELSFNLIQFAKKCLYVLGANNVVNHMELFVKTNGDIVFLEVSARPPGAYLNLTHRINHGINLVDIDFALQSGLNVNLNAERTNEKAFFAIFPLKPGRVIALKPPHVSSRFDMTWHVDQGDAISPDRCTNIINKAAHAIFYGTTLQQLRDDFNTIKHHQAIEVAR